MICGSGIAGISAAYFLAVKGYKDIILVDELPPLTLTSSRSTECYRNWWPDPEMLSLMNRSIDILEKLANESSNVFSMNRRGYLFVTSDISQVSEIEKRARTISSLGAGPFRVHNDFHSDYMPHSTDGYTNNPSGADLLLGSALIQRYFPYLTKDSIAALHVRRAGWLSAQQLGMHLLELARDKGVTFKTAKVISVDIQNNEVRSVELNTGERIRTYAFINAAGPYFRDVGRLCGLELPVRTELHLKVAFKDPLAAIAREAPLLIWDDPQSLDWDQNEAEFLSSDPETRWLTGFFPSGAHTRPEGGPGSEIVLMLWEYQTKTMEPVINPPLDEYYPEVALRGMSRMIPVLKRYFGRTPRPLLDGGFYTKSKDNRPIVGRTSINGVYLIGALSGYGIMSACGVGELLSQCISNSDLPPYAKAFSLERFDDPDYQKWMETLTDSGQL